MAKNIGVADLAEKAILETVQNLGYEIWDVEYVKEGAEQYLRVTIDNENGIDINDCEKVHREILPILENFEWDHLEVSSPGAERTLKKASHFMYAIGETIEVKLFAPDAKGKKSYTGVLEAADEKTIKVNCDGEVVEIDLSKVGKANTVFDFTSKG
ncbi:MAG: ribosome maturation factor RimP [Clostridia bacterium]|nr:ribosome maturation factor RimP [Clostridia bacterium]